MLRKTLTLTHNHQIRQLKTAAAWNVDRKKITHPGQSEVRRLYSNICRVLYNVGALLAAILLQVQKRLNAGRNGRFLDTVPRCFWSRRRSYTYSFHLRRPVSNIRVVF